MSGYSRTGVRFVRIYDDIGSFGGTPGNSAGPGRRIGGQWSADQSYDRNSSHSERYRTSRFQPHECQNESFRATRNPDFFLDFFLAEIFSFATNTLEKKMTTVYHMHAAGIIDDRAAVIGALIWAGWEAPAATILVDRLIATYE
jgi:hypothetical protein